MPTAQCFCSSISHGSSVIVASGVTCWDPWTMTRAVDVLYIKENSKTAKSCSQWIVVEQLPHVVRNAIPLIISDKLHLTQGYDEDVHFGTCNVITASLPEVLQSSNKNTSSGQVWSKLPDMPYSSFSINHYHGRLITFGGSHQVERSHGPDPVWQSVPLIHIYNHYTRTWDCVVGDTPWVFVRQISSCKGEINVLLATVYYCIPCLNTCYTLHAMSRVIT